MRGNSVKRTGLATATLVLGLLAGACKTSQDSNMEKPSTGDYAGENKIRFKSEGSGSTGEPGVVDYVSVPFENILYWPWKVVGTGVKGAADGVGSGFAKERMPILGAIFSPVNLVIGFVTGMGEGIALEPGAVGVSDSFSHAMAKPMKHPTTIWWY